MPEFKYEIKLNVDKKETALKIMEALTSLSKTMSPDDLVFFAKKVKDSPGLIAKAKSFL